MRKQVKPADLRLAGRGPKPRSPTASPVGASLPGSQRPPSRVSTSSGAPAPRGRSPASGISLPRQPHLPAQPGYQLRPWPESPEFCLCLSLGYSGGSGFFPAERQAVGMLWAEAGGWARAESLASEKPSEGPAPGLASGWAPSRAPLPAGERRAYPVGLGRLLHQDGRVRPVLPGLPAHDAQQLAVVLAVVVQLFPVPLTQPRVRLLLGRLPRLPAPVHLQPLNVLHQAGQLPHWPDILLLKRLLAQGADGAAP